MKEKYGIKFKIVTPSCVEWNYYGKPNQQDIKNALSGIRSDIDIFYEIFATDENGNRRTVDLSELEEY